MLLFSYIHQERLNQSLSLSLFVPPSLCLSHFSFLFFLCLSRYLSLYIFTRPLKTYQLHPAPASRFPLPLPLPAPAPSFKSATTSLHPAPALYPSFANPHNSPDIHPSYPKRHSTPQQNYHYHFYGGLALAYDPRQTERGPR